MKEVAQGIKKEMQTLAKPFKDFGERIISIFSKFFKRSKDVTEHVFTAYKQFDYNKKCYPTKIDFRCVKMVDQVIERKPKNLIKKTNM